MSTRSNIGIENSDGTVESIYSHWDGYLEGVGRTLFNYYDTEEKVRELLSYGFASSIDKTIDTCIFYKRDRNETNVDSRKFESRYTIYTEEYNYLFSNGEWLVSEGESNDYKELYFELMKIYG